jgi:hypothetical protein
MYDGTEGVITIVVADKRLRLELVKDVGVDVDVLIASNNPRYGVLMDMLGDELRIGPIVCESEADVNRLVARISKKPDIQMVVDELMSDRFWPETPMIVLCSPEAHESMKMLSHFSETPLHHRLNQHPTRPGKQPKSKQLRHRPIRR